MSWKFVSVAIVLAATVLRSQAPPLPISAFDVASIKPTPPNPPVTTIGGATPDGRWSPRNVTVQMILSRAYPEYSTPGMIVGGPAWVGERRFDIDAKSDGPATPAQYPQMIRQLLADRFRLKTHIEARPIDVYALVAARTDGRLGPRLQRASAQCSSELAAARELERALRAGVITPPTTEPPRCNARRSVSNGVMRLTGGRSMSELAAALQNWTERKVIDRTGLDGDYEMDLEFDFRATLSVDAAGTTKSSAPTVSTAVQEQLGLKLERSQQSLDVLIIDSIELPSEN